MYHTPVVQNSYICSILTSSVFHSFVRVTLLYSEYFLCFLLTFVCIHTGRCSNPSAFVLGVTRRAEGLPEGASGTALHKLPVSHVPGWAECAGAGGS